MISEEDEGERSGSKEEDELEEVEYERVPDSETGSRRRRVEELVGLKGFLKQSMTSSVGSSYCCSMAKVFSKPKSVSNLHHSSIVLKALISRALS